MQETMRRLLHLLVLAAAACGGSPDEEIPVCTEAGSVAFAGELDGEEVSERLTTVAFTDEDLTGPTRSLEIAFSSTGLARIALEYGDEPDGGERTYAARGYIDLSERGGLVAGNCNIDGFISTVRFDADGLGGTFTFRGLREQPFCDGRSMVGVINGCFRVPE